MDTTAAQAVSSENTNSPSSSLLSLSILAASAERIPVTADTTTVSNGSSSLPSGGNANGNIASAKLHPTAPKHRRLSSAGLTKRRLSDAREATSRPSAVTIQTAAAALSSLATLSLSGSPPPQGQAAASQTSASFTSASGIMKLGLSDALNASSGSGSVKQEDDELSNAQEADSILTTAELSVGGISIKNGTGKKRGTIFKCESCSKVYRHPSCLIKHRWEHSPHWREASKFLLSKHQQVQLLEAAAILSHISPSASGGTSLPEDRSLWPSFLSGGLLPPPSTAHAASSGAARKPSPSPSSLDPHPSFPVSSSVPASSIAPPISRSTSSGPRLHDYSIPTSGAITHVRPGVFGVSTGSNASTPSPAGFPSRTSEEPSSTSPRTVPVPVPLSSNSLYRDTGRYSFVSGSSDPWTSSPAFAHSYHSDTFSVTQSYGTGGWSLPRSSMRSVSEASASGSGSRSRSGSAEKSDDEGDEIDIEVDDLNGGQRYGFISRGRTSATRHGWKVEDEDGVALKPREDKIEEEWDVMEMDMEM